MGKARQNDHSENKHVRAKGMTKEQAKELARLQGLAAKERAANAVAGDGSTGDDIGRVGDAP